MEPREESAHLDEPPHLQPGELDHRIETSGGVSLAVARGSAQGADVKSMLVLGFDLRAPICLGLVYQLPDEPVLIVITKKISTLMATALISVMTLFGTAYAAPMPAQPHPWDHRAKCETKDPDDRKIVARYGNSEFGWKHFSGPHNIKKCSTLYAALHGEVDRKSEQGRKLEYDAVAFETGVPRPRQVKITVVVWQARKSLDGRYDAGRGNTIGVITAYCHNQRGNKCPAWAKL